MDRGAASVKLIDRDSGAVIEVTCQEFHQAISNDKQSISQNVNVNVTASAHTSISIYQQLDGVIRDIDRYVLSQENRTQACERLKKLEDELKKRKPKWQIIKNILGWVLKLSQELFLKVAAIVVEYYLKKGQI